ncbi:MAG: sulfate permease [Pseudohongiellaceae bacterium]|nr:sulfate permease [Pseudohongiellaceae bacterium]
MKFFMQYLPILRWARQYNSNNFRDDSLAALIVSVMLIPQALAYALIAGLPPQLGLYASILPLLAYSLFGSSKALSVGPVAVISLMTAVALGSLSLQSLDEYITAALTLAVLTGLFLLLLGALRLGFLANFMSHPVVSGFVTASAIIIILSQTQHLLGTQSAGYTLPSLLYTLWQSLPSLNWFTVGISVWILTWLFWARTAMVRLLMRIGIADKIALLLARLSPVFAVLVSAIVVAWLNLEQRGVATIGAVEGGLPSLVLPSFSVGVWQQLAGSAALLGTIAFVESISVAQGLAARRRERIDPNQELIGLGAANIASGISSGFPVAGGFSRSVVNHDAGAATPAAGIIAAIFIAIVCLYLTPVLSLFPKATLAATIIVAAWSLLDFSVLRKSWHYSKADFCAVTVTIALTLFTGVEIGVAAGILVSLLIHIYKTSRPHVVEVGEVPGTEHFRNINRHQVETHPSILSIRVDESLYFANSRYLEDVIYSMVAKRDDLKHVILMCTAVNEVDLSALESVLAINRRLRELGIKLHMSEVKGPVMDSLVRVDFLTKLSGNVYMSQHQAVEALKPK